MYERVYVYMCVRTAITSDDHVVAPFKLHLVNTKLIANAITIDDHDLLLYEILFVLQYTN